MLRAAGTFCKPEPRAQHLLPVMTCDPCRDFQAAFASALDDCNYSLSMKPKYVKVLMRRAAVLDKLDKLEEALAGDVPVVLVP